VVDEVLAVGDAEFQKKAIGKMQDVSKGEGRTVLFVSHNMSSIKYLCNSGILLKNGSIFYSGNIENTVTCYMGENYKENTCIYFEDLSTALGNDDIRVKSFDVAPITGNEINVESGLGFTLLFYNYKANIILDTTFELSTAENVIVFHTGKVLTPDKDSKKGFYQVRFDIPPFTLNTGKYKMKLIFGENQRYPLFIKEDILCFEIENTLTGQGYNMNLLPGIMKPKFNFTCDFLN
jgi:lipopolysaccharide transport system ATP-binding protein